MNVAGEMTVQLHVQHQSQLCVLPLLVVNGTGPALFGHNWLHHIKLNWKTIGLVAVDGGQVHVQEIVKRYPAIFKVNLGSKQHICANVTTVFCKPRPVLFALKEATSKEIDWLKQAGII